VLELDLDFKAFLRRHPDLWWKTVVAFCKVGQSTRNGHIYSRELWERELEKQGELIPGVLHEAHNPDRIMLSTVAFLIERPRIDGGEVKGDLKLLDTHAGRLLRTYMEAGGRVAFTSRGIGRVDDNGMVQDDFQFEGVEAVLGPSAL
jgi:hypothetical protein